MTKTTMARARAWTGPALFSYGFRPFFLFGGVYAGLLVAVWTLFQFGLAPLPSALPPLAWHAHELLFGYAPAVVAGFLLTAVPNWTGRLPVVGMPLVWLSALWLVGRFAVAFFGFVGPFALYALTIAFPLALAIVIGREIVAGGNWRNLKVLAAIVMLAVAQTLFHVELWRTGHPKLGERLAIATLVLLIAIIGGRIIPSFTINWIKRANPGRMPVPFSAFDKVAMVAAGVALLAWTALPLLGGRSSVVGAFLGATALMHFVRLARWAPDRTLREPLVTVLHVAYAFVPLGFVLAALEAWRGDAALETATIHTWAVGAIGLMTVAVMTRATRGHTGHALTAPPSTVAVYGALFVAALARICAALLPAHASLLIGVAGAAWALAFLGFALVYGPLLASPRKS